MSQRYQRKEEFKPLEVERRGNESVDRMVKRLTKMMRDDGILQEYIDRRYHTKKSEVRRKKRRAAKWAAQNIKRK